MKISAKTEYACLAMIELAASFGTGEPVRLRKIADEQGIPSRFLVQILLQLKGAGLVASLRGAAGGYRLTKRPEQISLAEVMWVIDGQEAVTSSAGVATPSVAVLMETWGEIAESQRERLESITLADLVERATKRGEPMYYI